jgi:hypothetical protein
MQRRQSLIARCDLVAALFFQILEKRDSPLAGQVCQPQSGYFAMRRLDNKIQKKDHHIPVTLD